VNDVISLTAAFTTTASVARITRHTTGRTPATTEAWVDTEVADARLSLSHEPRLWTGERKGLLIEASYQRLMPHGAASTLIPRP